MHINKSGKEWRVCGHESNVFEAFLDLSLDLHNETRLEDLLKKSTEPTYLDKDNMYKCEVYDIT
jgi:ubiquitin carboxyl-terminal hydrolase 36/42